MLAAEGASVMVADPDVGAAERVAGLIGDSARHTQLSIANQSAWNSAAEATLHKFGNWNVLVNCEGFYCSGSIEDISLKNWHTLIETNVFGTMRGCRIAVNHFKLGGGSIINLSSVAGFVGGVDRCAYDSANGAVRLLTKSVALYCAERDYKVRCNSIHVGIAESLMAHSFLADLDMPEERPTIEDSSRPWVFQGEPTDVGHMIVYLASEESRIVTGAELVVDGGRTAK